VNGFFDRFQLESIKVGFDLSFPSSKRFEHLLVSVKEFGIITPLVLFEKDSTLFLLDGAARLNIAKKLKIFELPGIVLKDFSEKRLIHLWIHLNSSRGLSLIEKSKVVVTSLQFFSEKEVIKEVIPKLGHPPAEKWFFFFKELSGLEKEVKVLLNEELLNPKLVSFLSSLREEEQKIFIELVKRLNLSFSEQLQVIEALIDLKKRTGSKELLPDVLREALKEEDFNKRRHQFFTKLYELYYPNYYPKKLRVDEIRNYLMSKGIRAEVHPFFEKKEVTFIKSVKTLKDLDSFLNSLKEEKHKVEKLLEIL